jgi:hypothetical protein
VSSLLDDAVLDGSVLNLDEEAGVREFAEGPARSFLLLPLVSLAVPGVTEGGDGTLGVPQAAKSAN